MPKRTLFTSEACRGHFDAAASFASHFNPLRLIALSLILTLIAPPAAPAQFLSRRMRIAPQIVGGCFSANSDNLIPMPCLPDLGPYAQQSSILQFQQQGLADFLQAYGLPSDQNLFYNTAGRSLRDEVRAFMYLELQNIIGKPAAQRTSVEQDVYNWFDAWMSHFDAALYNAAHTEYLKYQYDPCHYALDSTVQQFFGIEYDSTNCSNLGALFLPPQQPSAEYYKAVGYEKSFGALVVDPLVAVTLQDLAPLSQVGLSAGPLGAAVAFEAVVVNFKSIAPFAARVGLSSSLDAVETVGEAASDSTAAAVGEGFTAGAAGAGVFFIVVAALMVLVEGAINFANIQQVISGLAAFDNDFTTKTAAGYVYDLSANNSDPEQQSKMQAAWAYLSSNAIDLTPSSLPAPSANLSISTGSLQVPSNAFQNGNVQLNLNTNYVGTANSVSDNFLSTDWEGRTWLVSLYGDHYFLKTCLSASINDPTKNGKPLYPCYGPEVARTIETLFPNATLSGFGVLEPYFYYSLISRVDNTRFNTTITGTSDDPTLFQLCPVNPTTGVSDQAGQIPACNGFVDTVAYAYNGGILTGNDPTSFKVTRIATIQPPVFSSASNIGFVVGQARQVQVQAASPSVPGTPVTYTTGTCGLLSENPPPGVTFNSQGLLSYDGSNQAIGSGTFDVCAQMPNNGPEAYQTLTISFGAQPAIISSTQLTVFSGIPFSQKIYTSGYPPPSLTISNLGINDPFGHIHFQDNGDGSGTVSGAIPFQFQWSSLGCVPGSLFNPATCPFVIATSATGSVNSPFSITSVPAPSPIGVVPPLNFIAGTANSILISTTNSVSPPVLSALPPGTPVSQIPAAIPPDTSTKTPLANEPWLTFQDNGNGTATLAGTPPAGTNASIGLRLVFNGQYVIPSVDDVTLQVTGTPVFTNSPNVIFTEGTASLTAVTTASPATIAVDNAALPSGVTVFGSAIGGTPQSVGFYPIPFTATNASGAITQPLNLFVVSPPGVSLLLQGAPTSLFLQAGATATINVTTTGFPQSTPPASWPAQLGGGMTIGFTTSLPTSSYTFSGTTDPTGKLSGSGLLKFAPTTAQIGAYTATLSAANGVTPNASLPLIITVVQAGDTNHDGTVDCSDFTIVRNALGKVAGQPGYDLRADINYDGIVDVRDFSFVSAHLPAGTVCH